MEEKGIVPQKRTGEILRDTTVAVAAGLAGLATSEKKALTLSASHIFQGFLKGRFIDQFTKEWQEYVDKGKIEDDYETSSQHRDTLQEMLRFLDEECPDESKGMHLYEWRDLIVLNSD
ncbi:MAG: hypothetical protein ACYTET_03045 [Planctomycetota bacterium]|jgi:hypothetical protein